MISDINIVFVSMTSTIHKRSIVHDHQVAIICYMQALFQYLSIATQSSNHTSPHTCHTYHPSQVQLNHRDGSRPSVLHLSRITAGLFNQLTSARLSSIQTIQHALHQLSLALSWFPGLLNTSVVTPTLSLVLFHSFIMRNIIYTENEPRVSAIYEWDAFVSWHRRRKMICYCMIRLIAISPQAHARLRMHESLSKGAKMPRPSWISMEYGTVWRPPHPGCLCQTPLTTPGTQPSSSPMLHSTFWPTSNRSSWLSITCTSQHTCQSTQTERAQSVTEWKLSIPDQSL